ncbi:MAG: hypothetical protein AAFV43_16380 [Planctomycetota bacterium]
MRVLLACMCAVLGTSVASAATSAISVVTTPGVLTDTTPVVVNDLFIDFEGELGGQQLLVTLDTGTFYNQIAAFGGGDTAPLGVLTTTFPDTGLDTRVGLGALTSDDLAYTPTSIFGGAVNLGGDAAAAFDPTVLNVTFAPAVGETVDGGIGYQIARLTLSSDANGIALAFSSTTDGSPALQLAGTVVDGVVILIPEPATGLLAALAGVFGFARRV